jgi:hypothetical protein
VAVVWGRLSDLDAAVPKLTVELVPKTCWWSNLHTLADKATGIAFGGLSGARRITAARSAKASAFAIRSSATKCGSTMSRLAHRSFADDRALSRLPRGRAYGLCGKRGRNKSARDHLAKVNGWTNDQVLAHVAEAFAIWRRRSKVSWKLDLSGLHPYVGPEELAVLLERANKDRVGGRSVRYSDVREPISERLSGSSLCFTVQLFVGPWYARAARPLP